MTTQSAQKTQEGLYRYSGRGFSEAGHPGVSGTILGGSLALDVVQSWCWVLLFTLARVHAAGSLESIGAIAKLLVCLFVAGLGNTSCGERLRPTGYYKIPSRFSSS